MTFLDGSNSPKFDFMQNQSGSNIIKFQQSQALTSHFESFYIEHSVVQSVSFEKLQKQKAVAQKWCIFDPRYVGKAKLCLRGERFFQFTEICLHFQLFASNFSDKLPPLKRLFALLT